ncbi:ribosome 60S biogenesis N-terminal-domain-containing protein [Salix suchowensis]|nr:ribosome 60S biogenesis N-terminal-domain-containing protein [Salix suchowensis]
MIRLSTFYLPHYLPLLNAVVSPLVTPDIKVHLVEPLLTVVSKKCLANKYALDLSTALVKHPANTCQPTHVEPLVRIYQGSLSVPDRQYSRSSGYLKLSAQRPWPRYCQAGRRRPTFPQRTLQKQFIASILVEFCGHALGFLVGAVLKCRGPRPQSTETPFTTPSFYFCSLHRQCRRAPNLCSRLVELFRTNIVCLVIRTLSSRDEKMRERPELDTHDIPMLYGMLYSSSDAWKKERGWIIRFLTDGMISTNDWRVLSGGILGTYLLAFTRALRTTGAEKWHPRDLENIMVIVDPSKWSQLLVVHAGGNSTMLINVADETPLGY